MTDTVNTGGSARPTGELKLSVRRVRKGSVTKAERLDVLCQRLNATYERQPTEDGVRLALILANTTRIVGEGADIEEALSALEKQLKSWRII